MRNFILILASSLLFAFSAVAQAPAKGAQAGPPTLGRAFGKVTDTSGKPIEQASVLLLKAGLDPTTKKKKLVLLKGMDTKASGEFNFEDLPIVGQLVLRVSASGYKSKDIPFMVMTPGAPKPAGPTPAGQSSSNPFGNMPSFEKDLGTIALASDVKEISGVVINATPPAMKLELDKKVFNVEKNIVSAGGTAVDVMRNVPSVNVDIDGNVTLRGASPTIFVDGRPTTLTLDEIPADAIESVEVMTNPSAKYDASGGGSGILNIVLKKNRKKGYNGNISAGIDSHGAPNSMVSFNIRQGKVNFTATGLFNGINSKTTGNTDRTTFLGNGSHLLESDLTRTKAHFLFGQVGADYFVSNRTTLSGSYIKVHGKFDPEETSQIETDSTSGGSSQKYFSTRYTKNDRWFDVNGAQLGMKHTFAKDGESWTADGSYFGVTSSGTANYTTKYYTGAPGTPVAYTTQQQTVGTAAPAFYTIQTDYVNPLTAKTKLEAGLRASIQHLENDNSTYNIDNATGKHLLDTFSVSNYKSTSQVYAAYATITSAIGSNFGYQVGLRAESSQYSGDLTNVGKHFSHNYPVSLFPSIFLSEKLKHDQELQFSATRKINRPSFFQLIPYTDYSDTLNIQRGNPDLVPEFAYNLEFSYIKTFKHNNTLLASIYYKNTQNLITRFQQKGINPVGDSVLINTWENANSAESYGAEVTSTNTITKWWDMSANVNVYNAHINTDNLNEASQNALWSWFGKLNSNFKLPYRFTIQLTAAYQSKTNLPVNQNQQQFGPPNTTTQASAQGYIKPFWGMDVAVKRTFFKNDAGSVTVSFSDIFRTRWQYQYSLSPGLFSQEFDRLKDPQLVRVVFAYRFGKMDLNLFKRKDMNNQGMGDAGSSLQ